MSAQSSLDFNVYPIQYLAEGFDLPDSLVDGGSGVAVVGISTTGDNFTTVPPQDTLLDNTATVDGNLVAFTVNANGQAGAELLDSLNNGSTQDAANAINQNNLTSTTGALTDTLYYKLQDASSGTTSIEEVTLFFGDVDVRYRSYGPAISDVAGSSAPVQGISVTKYLSNDGNPVAVNPLLSVEVSALAVSDSGDLGVPQGNFAVSPVVPNNATVTTQPGVIVITGTQNDINADLATLTYTGTQNGTYYLGIQTTDESYVNPPDYTGATNYYTEIDVNCYRAGTRILTERGEVEIEALTPGDTVVIARVSDGAVRTVTWTGHRRTDCTRHPKPEAVWPILVCKDAFAEGQPSRDLWLSPGHSVYVESVLMQIERLVNGTTIRQVRRDNVDYWHVELDSHDIVFAEGLPTESYLDTGNRAAFVGGETLELHPDFRPKHWTETCVPLVFEGAEMQRAKARLLARAIQGGYAITARDDLHVVADGRRVEAMRLGSDRVTFALPDNCKRIALRSNTFTPAHCDSISKDTRTLGVCVAGMQIDGLDVAIEDEAAFTREGWHDVENYGDQSRRWTTGVSSLPPGTRFLVLALVGRGYYWEVEAEMPALVVGSDRAGH